MGVHERRAVGGTVLIDTDPLIGDQLPGIQNDGGGNTASLCRGLPCDDFARMEVVMGHIKQEAAVQHGGQVRL